MPNFLFKLGADLSATYGSNVVTLDRGGSGSKFGVDIAGTIAHDANFSSTDGDTDLTEQLANYLRAVATQGVDVWFIQLISSGAPSRNPDGHLCVKPQNGRRETINAHTLSGIAARIFGHPVTVSICNDVEGAVAELWSPSTEVHNLTPAVAPDPEGSLFSAVFASGFGGNKAHRLPSGDEFVYSGNEPGHVPAVSSVPKYWRGRYPVLANDLDLAYRYVTEVLRRRWTPETGGVSCQSLHFAYQAITGGPFADYDGTQAKAISRLAHAGDEFALRAYGVSAFQLANTLYGVAMQNVTGGVRAWGPMVEKDLDLLLKLGLMEFFTNMDPMSWDGRDGEPYHDLAMRTPIAIATSGDCFTLRGAAATARQQMMHQMVAA